MEDVSYSTLTTADSFKTLGLEPGATPAAVKAAYRKLCLKHHPDKARNDPGANAKFAKIREAYEVLTGKLEPAENRRRRPEPGSSNSYGERHEEPPSYSRPSYSRPSYSRPSYDRPPSYEEQAAPMHFPSSSWYPEALRQVRREIQKQLSRIPEVEQQRRDMMKVLVQLAPPASDERIGGHATRIRQDLEEIEDDLQMLMCYVEVAQMEAGAAPSRLRSLLDQVHEGELEITRVATHLSMINMIACRAMDVEDEDDSMHMFLDMWIELIRFR
ncbi:hypothetical protein JX266_011846 [Neoarthrinium moseri]|nr:hypothetical protein JX266_011846 [Neoarthrinium moseri]